MTLVSYELSGTLLEQVSRLLGDWAIFAWLFSKTKPPSLNGSADSRQKSKHWPYCTHGSYVSKLVDSQISSYRAFSINSQWLWYPTPNKHHGKHENDITTSKCVIIFFKNSTCKQANNSHVTHKLSCGFQWKTSIVFALLPTRSKTSPHSAHMTGTINSNATYIIQVLIIDYFPGSTIFFYVFGAPKASGIRSIEYLKQVLKNWEKTRYCALQWFPAQLKLSPGYLYIRVYRIISTGTHFRSDRYIIGTPGILRIRRLKSLSHVATM